MNISTAASVASLIVASLALVVSIFIAVRQLRFLRHSNTLPVAVELFREFRSSEFSEHKRYIQEELWRDFPPGELGLTDLPESAKAHVAPVAGFFNNAGLLVANGIVDELLFQSFMGGSTMRTWWRLRPYIEVDRERRKDKNFHAFYEHLAARCIRTSPEELGSKLRLEAVPADWAFDVDRYDRRPLLNDLDRKGESPATAPMQD